MNLKTTSRGILREEGATTVEMALSSIVMLAVLFGIMEINFAFYAYQYVSDAVREGTRYAIVRGSTSCTNTPDLTNCDATAAQIQAYITGLSYPGIDSTKLNSSIIWLKASTTQPTSTQPTTWTSCGVTICNAPGNAVQVTVTYTFPMSILYWKATTLNITSTSQMVISQ
jgi:Flp pilus assembly protein TadG